MTELVPEPLLVMGPLGLMYWQWIAIAIALPAAFVLGAVCARIVHGVVRHITSRTDATIDDEILSAFAGPLRFVATIGWLRLAVPFLELPEHARDFVVSLLRGGLGIALLWGTMRTVDVAVTRVSRAEWVRQRPSSRALLSLIGRAAKVIVIVIALIGVLSGLGLPVSSLLAGLGIGGIALAFGAQKTVENLFGAIAIGVDQPFREGDFVKIEDNVLGTVEAVGLRSSQVRTLDRTLVTLPNGKLSDMRVESYTARDRCRLATTVRLVYGTTVEQLRTILTGLEGVLRAHPRIWPDAVIVKLSAFGDSSLDIEVMAWFTTSDWGEFQGFRQEVLLAFMEVVERAGSSLAVPARTVHLARGE